jgi:PAS domain S-box-containing protein
MVVVALVFAAGLYGRRFLELAFTIVAIDHAPIAARLEGAAVVLLLAALAATTGWLGVVLWFGRMERANSRQVIRMDRLIQVRSAINEAIVRIHERESMLARFCEIAVSLGRFDFAVIFELPGQRIVRLRAWHGVLPDRFGSTTEFPLEDGLRHGPLGPLFESGQVAIIPDLRAERPDPWITALVEAGHRAVVFIPIREGTRVSGLFGLYSKEVGVFDHRDAQLFSELAGDISFALESVEADKDRRVVEAQLHAVSDAAPFAMFLIEQKDHRIDRVNPAAARQYGYTEDELVGLPATIIFSHDQLTPTLPLGDGPAPLPVTATHRTKDGRSLKVEVTTRPIQIDGAAYDVVVAIDVTERRQLEEQYRQAQRLEAVGKLAGGIAHDFNNLLTVIGGFSAFVLEDLPADSPARAAAQQIQIAANRAAELTGQLLAFSRRQTMVTKRVRLNDVVRETATMLARLIGEDVVLDLRLEAGRDAVNVDPSQMQQVIMNLAVNARDAMKKGGRLTIATAERDDTVELRIADTGDGIPPEVLEHIFEPFFTTKPPGQGTGLGLPTVHGIVAQSNGEVSVQTKVGGGTTFTIRLPRIDGDEHAVDARPPEPAQAGHGTILLVEDDPGVRALTKLVLLRGGYTVIECANGAAALDRATASTQLPIGLLVTDVVMPGMSGPELAERLRAYYPGLGVLFISGYAEDAASRLGLDLTKLDLLRKPFAPNDLLQRVKGAIARTQQK